MFAQGMFQIDPNATPDQVERKRAMIAALMPRFGQAKYVGEGLGQLATGIAMGSQNRKLDRAENAGRQGASDLFSRIMGGARGDTSGFSILGQGQQAASRPTDPNDPVNIAGDTMTALGKDAGTSGYRASLIGTESGGNWKAQNSEMGAGGKKGHFGRVQFGQARLQEAMDAGAIPQGTTPEQFMNSPALQIAAENWHFSDLERQLSPLVGTVVNGKPLDMGALVAMGHLGGAAGARRFVETGGRYNPSDTFGTSLADYAAKHGGLSSELSSAARPVQASTNEAAIYEALANPWLNAQQRAALTDMLSQSRQNADPMRQLEMQKLQKEVELMGQPKAPTPTDDMREYEFAKQQGFEGTFTDFMTAMRSAGATRVDVNTGSQPRPELLGTQGLVAIPDDSVAEGYRVVPAPGSPIAEERAQTAQKKDRTAEQSKMKLGTTLQSLNLNIGEIENGGAPVTGAIGDFRRTMLGRALTGNSAVDFENRSRQITDAAAFAEIQNMRDNSPTGGAVGQLTDAERVAIGNAVTALNSSTSAEEYLRAAKAYRSLALDMAYGPGMWQLTPDGEIAPNAPEAAVGAAPQGAIDFSTMSIDDLSNVDVNSLTPEQMDAMLRRYNEVGQ